MTAEIWDKNYSQSEFMAWQTGQTNLACPSGALFNSQSLTISEMDGTYPAKRPRKLSEFLFDCMYIFAEESDNVDRLCVGRPEEVFSGCSYSGWKVYGILVFIIRFAFFFLTFLDGFIGEEYTKVIHGKICIDLLFDEFRFLWMKAWHEKQTKVVMKQLRIIFLVGVLILFVLVCFLKQQTKMGKFTIPII